MQAKIIKIEELDEMECVDIEVSGNHLFFANNILTHNSNSDIELTDTSESMGLVHTADLMLALIRTEELDEINQILIKQLKNRYADTAINKRFVVGINRSRMKLFDLEKSAQTSISTASSFSPKGKMNKVEEPDIPLYDRSKPRPTDFGGFKF